MSDNLWYDMDKMWTLIRGWFQILRGRCEQCVFLGSGRRFRWGSTAEEEWDNLPTFPYTAKALRIATPKGKNEGGWDSIHVFEAVDRARTAHYKLTSTVILHLGISNENLGEMDLSGNMTRQIEQDLQVDDDDSHIVNIGKLVEDMELRMRNLLRKDGWIMGNRLKILC